MKKENKVCKHGYEEDDMYKCPECRSQQKDDMDIKKLNEIGSKIMKKINTSKSNMHDEPTDLTPIEKSPTLATNCDVNNIKPLKSPETLEDKMKVEDEIVRDEMQEFYYNEKDVKEKIQTAQRRLKEEFKSKTFTNEWVEIAHEYIDEVFKEEFGGLADE